MVDIAAAVSFATTHARLLDRRRLEHLLGGTTPNRVAAALDGYRNPDGGYGWGLEPDLRSSESQPVAALHAFEALADAGAAAPDCTGPLCDWLASISLDDGGLPFALPVRDPAGCAPWWAGHDAGQSSLQITAVVTAQAHRLARHDPVVASHPWVERATRYCLKTIASIEERPDAFVLGFALRFLDAAADQIEEADKLLAHLGRFLPPDGSLHVEGGGEHEWLRPLDYAPLPDRPVRQLLPAEAIANDLERLAAGQQPDGGWTVDFDAASPAAALEWRGYMTVEAISVLMHNPK